MPWTADQLTAITLRDKNILVSAAAGSGKTALLIERLRRLIIEENVSVDSLLVLTFTRAAAAEMKERLQKALMAEQIAENADRVRISEQLRELPTASITTIHAFCATLVRNYFQEGGVDPAFVVGNETELAIMFQESLEEILEEAYEGIPEGGENAFSHVVELYSGNRSDDGLKIEIEALYRFLTTLPNPEAWRNDAVAQLKISAKDYENTPQGQYAKKHIQMELQDAQELLSEAKQLGKGNEAVKNAYEQICEDYHTLLSAIKGIDESFDIESIHKINFERYRNSRKDKETSDCIKEKRDAAKKITENLKALFPENLEDAMIKVKIMAEPVQELLRLTENLKNKYRLKKEKKNLVDFNDLEEFTLKILKNKQIAEELKTKYRYVFLDEYQDTNAMQESILTQITSGNNYFMVGDVKQSIYRFRQAEPGIFIEKYKRFSESEPGPNALVTLSQNFRSAQGVIDSVNAVFHKVMCEELGEINYDHRGMLYKGLPNEGAYVPSEFHLLESGNPQKDLNTTQDVQVEDLTKEVAEARYIAQLIQDLVGKEYYDTSSGNIKIYKYRDIGVLMRAVKGRGEIFAEEFSKAGIPVYFDGGSQYYESMEIIILLNLLSLIDNSRLDIPLLSVLMSPIGGYTPEECAQIRRAYPKGHYYTAVEGMAKENSPLGERLQIFLGNLKKWRKASRQMTVSDFLWYLYCETGYYNFVSALPNGEQRKTNLKVLLKRAEDFQKSSMRGLFNFIRFIGRVKKHNYDTGAPKILSEKDDVVRIMSVHKSKGLEFPVVIMAGVGRMLRRRPDGAKITLHKDFGICPSYIDSANRVYSKTLVQSVCDLKKCDEDMSEELRLLYVAMTRAEEKLWLVGSVPGVEEKLERWQQPMTLSKNKKAQTLFDWVIPAIVEKENIEIKNFFNPKGIITNGVKIVAGSSEDLCVKEKELSEKNEADEKREQTKKEVIRRLNYVYPYKDIVQLPGKVSVTELKKLIAGDTSARHEELPVRTRRPLFMTGKVKVTPQQIGTAFHFMMQRVDLKTYALAVKNGDENKYLINLKQELVDLGLLEEEAAKKIDIKKICNFYASKIGKHLLAAEIVRRELPFNLRIKAATLKEEWSKIESSLTLQGIIDCCFIEGGKWIILDYKTDHYISSEEKQRLVERYKIQLKTYGKALVQLTGKPVSEMYLCFVRTEEVVLIED